MGRATPESSGAYRDDPDAVSLHTTPDGYIFDDAPEISGLPPSYSDSEDAASATPALPVIRHIPPGRNRKDHNKWYSLSGGVPQVCDTWKLMDSRYDTDPVYLEEDILLLSRTPPNPLIYIMGTHDETVKKGDKKETKLVIDFRIVINYQNYLRTGYNPEDTSRMSLNTAENGEKTYRGSFRQSRAPGFTRDIEVGSGKPSLKEWCHRYCASPAMLRA